MNNRYSKVIFVSMDGTCRSMWAQSIFNKNKKSNMLCGARGLVALFPEPANPKAVVIAKSKGLNEMEDMNSVQLKEIDFAEDILVLAMSDTLKRQIYDDFTNAVNVYTLREFTGEAKDVEVCHGGELIDYGERFEYLEKLILGVLDIIEGR